MPARRLEEAAFRPREIARLEQLAEAQERRAERWDQLAKEMRAFACACCLLFVGMVVSLFSPLAVMWQLHPWLAPATMLGALATIGFSQAFGPPQMRRAQEQSAAYRKEAETLKEQHSLLQASLPPAQRKQTLAPPSEHTTGNPGSEALCCDEG